MTKGCFKIQELNICMPQFITCNGVSTPLKNTTIPSFLPSPLLKLVSAIFYQIFIFSPNDNPSKTMKNVFLFHLKSSFPSQDIHIFVTFPLSIYTVHIQKELELFTKFTNLKLFTKIKKGSGTNF